MTHARENAEAGSNEAAASRKWTRPAVQRLAAGSAEDGSGPALDGILNPS
jgi:hypothetical protein